MKKYSVCFIAFFLFGIVLHAQQTPTPQWRPQYHFTPEKNWTNDPNGLIYLNGVYHLYNQQNPYENFWGHMSWGHATSTDLIHWKQLPIAIPEEIKGDDTLWRFSGSAVWDKDNTSGWCKTGGCIVAIYTVHEPHKKKQSQYVAYSNDGGLSFTNYENNPVIDLNKLDFRDPNVFWYEPGKFWLMTVVLPAEHKAQFYKSSNLRKWTLLSEFGLQGYTGANWECPFLLQLPVAGNPGLKKWILVISAAGGPRGVFQQYFVGDFNGKEFKNDNPSDSIFALDYGDTFYASIPWNNLQHADKTFIGWMIPNPQPTFPWRGQMSIPRDLTLRRTESGIRLYQLPATKIYKNLNALSGHRTTSIKDVSTKSDNYVLNNDEFRNNSYWLKMSINAGKKSIAGIKIAQRKNVKGEVIAETTVGYDATKKQVFVNRTKSGGELNKDKLFQTIDIVGGNKAVELEILMDKSSLEIFVDKGRYVLSTCIYPDASANGVSLFAENDSASFKNLKVWDLH